MRRTPALTGTADDLLQEIDRMDDEQGTYGVEVDYGGGDVRMGSPAIEVPHNATCFAVRDSFY
jgi:hypothetical protein